MARSGDLTRHARLKPYSVAPIVVGSLLQEQLRWSNSERDIVELGLIIRKAKYLVWDPIPQWQSMWSLWVWQPQKLADSCQLLDGAALASSKMSGSSCNHRLLRYPLLYHPPSQNKAQMRLCYGQSGPLFWDRGGIEGGTSKFRDVSWPQGVRAPPCD